MTMKHKNECDQFLDWNNVSTDFICNLHAFVFLEYYRACNTLSVIPFMVIMLFFHPGWETGNSSVHFANTIQRFAVFVLNSPWCSMARTSNRST